MNMLRTDDRAVMDTCREQSIVIERVPNVPHAFTVKNKTERELLEARCVRMATSTSRGSRP